jgi:hypothetical protein
VKQPNIDDYKKLTQCMRFLCGTINDPFTLEADKNLSLVKWWIGASYLVHPDMKSHTGGRWYDDPWMRYSPPYLQQTETECEKLD